MGQKVQGTKMVETVGGRSVLCLANKQLEDDINKAIQELAKEKKTVLNVTHNGIRRAMGGVLWVASATILWECDADLIPKPKTPEDIAQELLNEGYTRDDAINTLCRKAGLSQIDSILVISKFNFPSKSPTQSCKDHSECDNCGTTNKKGTRYCIECGSRL